MEHYFTKYTNAAALFMNSKTNILYDLFIKTLFPEDTISKPGSQYHPSQGMFYYLFDYLKFWKRLYKVSLIQGAGTYDI